MRELVSEIFGTYTPVETVISVDAAGNSIMGVASGVAGVDWPYVAGVVLFAITLYCFFRLLGVLLK